RASHVHPVKKTRGALRRETVGVCRHIGDEYEYCRIGCYNHDAGSVDGDIVAFPGVAGTAGVGRGVYSRAPSRSCREEIRDAVAAAGTVDCPGGRGWLPGGHTAAGPAFRVLPLAV